MPMYFQGRSQDLQGGTEIFFGDMLRFAKGFGGMLPQENIKNWCISVYILIKFCIKKLSKIIFSI